MGLLTTGIFAWRSILLGSKRASGARLYMMTGLCNRISAAAHDVAAAQSSCSLLMT